MNILEAYWLYTFMNFIHDRIKEVKSLDQTKRFAHLKVFIAYSQIVSRIYNLYCLSNLRYSFFPYTAAAAKSLHAAHQAPPSLGFSRQEPWSGLPFPSPMQESEKWKWSRSVMSDSLRPHGPQPTRLLRPWDFPIKRTGVGCHCLLRPIQ